eukprot:SAG22_NODE_99_length_20560_cov_128.669029_21_plen_156_part_00
MTWGQPPFYSRQMISQTWQPNAVSVTSNRSVGRSCPESLNRKHLKSWRPDGGIADCPGALSAQASDDGKTLVVRFVNMGAGKTLLSLSFKSKDGAEPKSAEMRLLHNTDLTAVNTPEKPLQISPTTVKMAPGSNFSNLAAVPVPAQAFAIIEVTF